MKPGIRPGFRNLSALVSQAQSLRLSLSLHYFTNAYTKHHIITYPATFCIPLNTTSFNGSRKYSEASPSQQTTMNPTLVIIIPTKNIQNPYIPSNESVPAHTPKHKHITSCIYSNFFLLNSTLGP